jgi:hypothetical protein
MRWTSGAFRYGFRPGRDAHQALDALNVGIARKKVNWILDVDIKGFFDHVSHEPEIQSSVKKSGHVSETTGR